MFCPRFASWLTYSALANGTIQPQIDHLRADFPQRPILIRTPPLQIRPNSGRGGCPVPQDRCCRAGNIPGQAFTTIGRYSTATALR